MSTLSGLKKELRARADPEKAKLYAKFFKTGKGEYGEGDKFLGLTVPEQRKISKNYQDLSLSSIAQLLLGSFHEFRFTALVILVHQYKKGTEIERRQIYKFYLTHKNRVNNWDLVDSSAPYIVGNYLKDKDHSILYKLAQSRSLWDRRIAVLATFWFIKDGDFKDALKISQYLLGDREDLIQKAVGWMLREIGKKDESTLIRFLDTYYRKMPRTMLRYAIERLTERKRQHYLKT